MAAPAAAERPAEPAPITTRSALRTRGGSADVRSHPRFKGLDFTALQEKALPAPYVPKIKSNTDDSNFDQYTEEGKINYPQEDFPRDMFKDFATDWVH